MLRDLRVQDPVLADDAGADIGEHGKLDPVRPGEVGERLALVVRHHVELDAGGAKLRQRTLHLHEMRHARGSPDGRAEKGDHRLRTAAICVQADGAAVRSGQLEVGEGVAQRGTGREPCGRDQPLPVASGKRATKPNSSSYSWKRIAIVAVSC